MIESKSIGGVQYNIARAPAIKQKELLAIVGSRIALVSAKAEVETINSQLLFGSLLSLPEVEFDRVASIVLYKTAVNGTDTFITVSDFQDNMANYFMLVAEAICLNLADFFTYLDSVNAETQAKAKSAVQ